MKSHPEPKRKRTCRQRTAMRDLHTMPDGRIWYSTLASTGIDTLAERESGKRKSRTVRNCSLTREACLRMSASALQYLSFCHGMG